MFVSTLAPDGDFHIDFYFDYLTEYSSNRLRGFDHWEHRVVGEIEGSGPLWVGSSDNGAEMQVTGEGGRFGFAIFARLGRGTVVLPDAPLEQHWMLLWPLFEPKDPYWYAIKLHTEDIRTFQQKQPATGLVTGEQMYVVSTFADEDFPDPTDALLDGELSVDQQPDCMYVSTLAPDGDFHVDFESEYLTRIRNCACVSMPTGRTALTERSSARRHCGSGRSIPTPRSRSPTRADGSDSRSSHVSRTERAGRVSSTRCCSGRPDRSASASTSTPWAPWTMSPVWRLVDDHEQVRQRRLMTDIRLAVRTEG